MSNGMMMQEKKLTTSDAKKETPFCLELGRLWYDRQYLIDHLNGTNSDDWYEFNCGHMKWTVHEAFSPRIECKNYNLTEFHYELARLFTIPITFDTMLYTSTPIGGTPPHQDRCRPAILNFAVTGEFGDTSPQTFYETYDRTSISYVMPYYKSETTNEFAPWMFLGSKIHGVNNTNDPKRVILSTCWTHNTYDEIVSKMKDGSLVDWEQNAKNKLIKFI